MTYVLMFYTGTADKRLAGQRGFLGLHVSLDRPFRLLVLCDLYGESHHNYDNRDKTTMTRKQKSTRPMSDPWSKVRLRTENLFSVMAYKFGVHTVQNILCDSSEQKNIMDMSVLDLNTLYTALSDYIYEHNYGPLYRFLMINRQGDENLKPRKIAYTRQYLHNFGIGGSKQKFFDLQADVKEFEEKIHEIYSRPRNTFDPKRGYHMSMIKYQAHITLAHRSPVADGFAEIQPGVEVGLSLECSDENTLTQAIKTLEKNPKVLIKMLGKLKNTNPDAV
jgi:hypothetical protein